MAVCLSCVASHATAQQVGANAAQAYAKNVQLLQRIDGFLYGVDPLSLMPLAGRFVSGVRVRVGVGGDVAQGTVQGLGTALSQPQYSHFLADCDLPLRLAILSTAVTPFDLTPQGASSRARIEAAFAAKDTALFSGVLTLDASRAVTEFACAATQRPAQAALIAKELFENGGPNDLRSALCDLRPDGASEVREDVEVRFSDSEKVVAVGKQWLTSGKVTDAEISFGQGGARWTVDRNTAEASLVAANGRLMFAGSCVAKPGR